MSAQPIGVPGDAEVIPMSDAGAPAAFILASNDYVARLQAVADDVQQAEPGTAELLRAHAEREAGLALDLISRWP